MTEAYVLRLGKAGATPGFVEEANETLFSLCGGSIIKTCGTPTLACARRTVSGKISKAASAGLLEGRSLRERESPSP